MYARVRGGGKETSASRPIEQGLVDVGRLLVDGEGAKGQNELLDHRLSYLRERGCGRHRIVGLLLYSVNDLVVPDVVLHLDVLW